MKSVTIVKIFCVLFGISFLSKYWVGEDVALPMLLSLPWGWQLGIIPLGFLIILLFNVVKNNWQIKNLRILLIVSSLLLTIIFFSKSEMIDSMKRSTLSKWSFIIFGVISIVYFCSMIFTYFQFRKQIKNTSLTTDNRQPNTDV